MVIQKSTHEASSILHSNEKPLLKEAIRKYYGLKNNTNRLSCCTSDYDCILAMLLGSTRNGRLEVTRFSVPTTSGTVSVIRRDALCNTSGLSVPGTHTDVYIDIYTYIFNPIYMRLLVRFGFYKILISTFQMTLIHQVKKMQALQRA